MKIQFSAPGFLTAAALFVFNLVSAQDNSASFASVKNKGNHAASAAVKSGTFTPGSALQESFTRIYPQAENTSWTPIENGYWVNFTNKGRKTTASLLANGCERFSITSLEQAQLPASLQETLRKDYKGYAVLKAVEINEKGNIVHQVVLENDKNYVTLKAKGEDLEVSIVTNSTAGSNR